jgi:hypothetical protein
VPRTYQLSNAQVEQGHLFQTLRVFPFVIGNTVEILAQCHIDQLWRTGMVADRSIVIHKDTGFGAACWRQGSHHYNGIYIVVACVMVSNFAVALKQH